MKDVTDPSFNRNYFQKQLQKYFMYVYNPKDEETRLPKVTKLKQDSYQIIILWVEPVYKKLKLRKSKQLILSTDYAEENINVDDYDSWDSIELKLRHSRFNGSFEDLVYLSIKTGGKLDVSDLEVQDISNLEGEIYNKIQRGLHLTTEKVK